MNCVQVILTIDADNLPANFQEILKKEQEVCFPPSPFGYSTKVSSKV